MSDPMTGSVQRCPWCSAALPEPGVEKCPSCQAALVTTSGSDPDIKGVTTLDPEAILRARAEVARPRNRFLSFLTGDAVEAASAREHQESLAEPSTEVKREMLRLQLDARQRELDAETVAIKVEAMTELGIHVNDLEAEDAAQLALGHEGPAADTGVAPAADPGVAPVAAPTEDEPAPASAPTGIPAPPPAPAGEGAISSAPVRAPVPPLPAATVPTDVPLPPPPPAPAPSPVDELPGD